MISGVNDTDLDADALAELLRGDLAHVNLIPMNPVAHTPWQASSPQRVAAFAARAPERRHRRDGPGATAARTPAPPAASWPRTGQGSRPRRPSPTAARRSSARARPPSEATVTWRACPTIWRLRWPARPRRSNRAAVAGRIAARRSRRTPLAWPEGRSLMAGRPGQRQHPRRGSRRPCRESGGRSDRRRPAPPGRHGRPFRPQHHLRRDGDQAPPADRKAALRRPSDDLGAGPVHGPVHRRRLRLDHVPRRSRGAHRADAAQDPQGRPAGRAGDQAGAPRSRLSSRTASCSTSSWS